VTALLPLDPERRRAFDRLTHDLARVFRDRLIAVVASSPVASTAFVDEVTAGDLEALAPLSASWHRDSLSSPLILTPAEFQRSLDAFPIEYQGIIDRHSSWRARRRSRACRSMSITSGAPRRFRRRAS
jgi:hypothetical protein